MNPKTKNRSFISQIKHVSIPVRDQDRALQFYREKLGLELLVDESFGEGERWIELCIPGAETQIVLFTPKGHEDRVGTFSNIVFRADDVEESYIELVKKGVEFTVPPTKESFGTYAIFKDSEGNGFCLSSE